MTSSKARRSGARLCCCAEWMARAASGLWPCQRNEWAAGRTRVSSRSASRESSTAAYACTSRRAPMALVDQQKSRRSRTGLIAHEPARAQAGYTLFAPMLGDGTVFLVDMDGKVIRWLESRRGRRCRNEPCAPQLRHCGSHRIRQWLLYRRTFGRCQRHQGDGVPTR
jgi:hypothetical protein